MVVVDKVHSNFVKKISDEMTISRLIIYNRRFHNYPFHLYATYVTFQIAFRSSGSSQAVEILLEANTNRTGLKGKYPFYQMVFISAS